MQLAMNMHQQFNADPRASTWKSFHETGKQLGAEMSGSTASRARQACLDAKYGNFDQGWATVGSALERVAEANPGTVWSATYNSSGRFEFAFIMLPQSQVSHHRSTS
jgi:hypothetical protein